VTTKVKLTMRPSVGLHKKNNPEDIPELSRIGLIQKTLQDDSPQIGKFQRGPLLKT
jgi:hypothetical protein